MNKTQESDWHSFPLFSLVGSILGFLYVPRLKTVGNCLTFLTISGEGYSTGKSLITDACMFALYGKKLDCTAPTTVPKLFDMLDSGTPIYGKGLFTKIEYWFEMQAVANISFIADEENRNL